MVRIRYIIRSIGSKADRSGNQYWYSTIIRTSDGKSFGTLTNGPSNVYGDMRQIIPGFKLGCICNTEKEVNIRNWEFRGKKLKYVKLKSFYALQKAFK